MPNRTAQDNLPTASGEIVAGEDDLGTPQPSQSVADGSVHIAIQPAMRRSHHSVVGGLTSAIVHMVVLITAGLVFATIPIEGAIELQFAVANTSSNESLEMMRVEVDLSSEQLPDTSDVVNVAITSSALSVSEPTLVTEFGDIAVSDDDVDVMSTLSESVDAPSSSQQAGEKSDKRGSFFGADAYGDEFVYLVDMSTSMGARSEYGQTRFRVACRELLRSIKELSPNQRFCVFMFCYRTRVMFDSQPRMIPATQLNKQRVAQWINGLGLGAGTDPRYGTMMALRLKPDAIFLLSDGEFNGREVNAHGIPRNPAIETLIERYRKYTVPIHTIAFEDMRNRKRLRHIANGTAGTHRFVGQVSDQDLLLDDLCSGNTADIAIGLRSILDGTQKIRDLRSLQKATKLVADQFTSRDASLRAMAYETMLFLAEDGIDMGPESADASHREFGSARKKWLMYWRDHFKQVKAIRAGAGDA